MCEEYVNAEKMRVVAGTARQREARHEESERQLQLAVTQLREERDALTQRVTALETEGDRARLAVGALAQDGVDVAPVTATLIPATRTGSSSEAPLTARTCEYLRRICEETGGSTVVARGC